MLGLLDSINITNPWLLKKESLQCFSTGMSGAPGMVEVEEVEEVEEEEDKGPSPNPVLKFILGKELASSNR